MPKFIVHFLYFLGVSGMTLHDFVEMNRKRYGLSPQLHSILKNTVGIGEGEDAD